MGKFTKFMGQTINKTAIKYRKQEKKKDKYYEANIIFFY